MFGPMGSTYIIYTNIFDESQPECTWWHDWGWASRGYYHKVMTKSSQGHRNQLQVGEHSLFLLVLLQFSSLEMSMVVETPLDPSMDI